MEVLEILLVKMRERSGPASLRQSFRLFPSSFFDECSGVGPMPRSGHVRLALLDPASTGLSPSYTSHPTPYNPTSYNPTPWTLDPTPCTLQPTPV